MIHVGSKRSTPRLRNASPARNPRVHFRCRKCSASHLQAPNVLYERERERNVQLELHPKPSVADLGRGLPLPPARPHGRRARGSGPDPRVYH